MTNFPAPMKYFISFYILLSLNSLQAQDYQSAIYQAYLLEHMDTWKALMVQMEEEYVRTKDPELLYELLEAEYGYMGWLTSWKRKDEAEEVLKSAERHMSLLKDRGLEDARVLCIKSAFYGYQIMLDPLKAPSLGKKSIKANEQAMKLDPNEPHVWLQKANIDYYQPRVFGGSKKRAVPSYEKALQLFESSPEGTRENWVYLNCMAGLGIAYENTRKYSEAGSVYRKLLELEPTFKWVKEDLYPKFREKHPEK